MSLSELGKAAAAKLHEAFKSNPKKEIDLNKVKDEAKKTRATADKTLIEDAFTSITSSPIGETLSNGEVDEFIQSVENLSGKGKVSVYPSRDNSLRGNEKKSFLVFDAFFKFKSANDSEGIINDINEKVILGADGKFDTADDNKNALVVNKNINSFFVDAKTALTPATNTQEVAEIANLVKTITGEDSLKNYVEQAGFVDSLKTLGIDKTFLDSLSKGNDTAKKDNFKAGLTVLKNLDEYLTTKQKVTDPNKRLPASLLKGGYRLTALRGIALMVGEDTLKNNNSAITKAVIKALSTTTGTDGKAYLASFLASQWTTTENAKAFDYVTNVSAGGPGAIGKAFEQDKLLAQAKDIKSGNAEKTAKGWLSMYGKAGIGGRSYGVLPNGDISKDASTDSNMTAFSVRWLMGGLPADFRALNTQLKEMNGLFDLENIAGLFNNSGVKAVASLAGIQPDAIQTKINEYKTLSSSSPEKFKDRMAALFATSIVSVKPATGDNRNIKVVVSNANLLKRIMGDKIDLPQAKQILGALNVLETQEMEMTVNRTSWDSATKADASSSPAFKILDQIFNTKINPNNPSATSTEATIVNSIAPKASTSANTNTSPISNLSTVFGIDLRQSFNTPPNSPNSGAVSSSAKPATTKLNLEEVQLDDKSAVSPDEASLRRILKIQQDLTGVMKATDPNSWINSNKNFRLLASSSTNTKGKQEFEQAALKGFQENIKKGDSGTAVPFKADYSVDTDNLSSDAKAYYESLKQTNAQIQATKLSVAQATLDSINRIDPTTWESLKEFGGITKPNDLSSWTVSNKLDDILELGKNIFYSFNNEKLSNLVYQMKPAEADVQSLKSKLANIDSLNSQQKRELISNLTTKELITICHGYMKYVTDVRSKSSAADMFAANMLSNFLNKEILIAEVANSDFATTYYLEAIKASVNSISPPAAANANPNSGTNDGSTVAVNPPNVAAPVTAQTASTTPNATNRLDFSTIHLDTDYTNVTSDEKEFRRFMEIRQEIAAIDNAAGNPRIGEFGSQRAISVALLSASDKDFPGKTKLDAELLKVYSEKPADKAFFEKYKSKLNEEQTREVEAFAKTKNSESKKYEEERIKKLTQYVSTIRSEDWKILEKFGIKKDSFIDSSGKIIANKVGDATDEVAINRQIDFLTRDFNYNYIMNSKLKSINPDPTTVNELKSEIAKATTIEQKRAFMQSLNAKQSITIASLLEKQYEKIKDTLSSSSGYDESMYKDSIRFILDKNMLLAEIGNSDYGTTVYFDVIKYGLDSSTAPATSTTANPTSTASAAPTPSTPVNTPPTVTKTSNTEALTNTDEVSRTLVIGKKGSSLVARDKDTTEKDKLTYRVRYTVGGKLFKGTTEIKGATTFTQDDIDSERIRFVWDDPNETEDVGFRFTLEDKEGLKTTLTNEVEVFNVKVQKTPASPQASSTTKPDAVASPPVAPTNAPQATGEPRVVELQNLLIKRGFYNGKVDGVLTAETRNAIVRAQNFYTISPANGSPSNALIDKLNSDTFISEGN